MNADDLKSPLLTDLYQLTMAYGYWQQQKHLEKAVFHLYFRKLPFDGGYAVAAGVDPALEYIDQFCFGDDEIQYLSELTGNDGRQLFSPQFLQYLANLKLSCNVEAVLEGAIVFPNEPLLRVEGTIIECQLLETALLNLINFSTLVATKSARICHAAAGDPVLEFGLRRAQGPDGGVTASRAAYIGGCVGTSNVLAGKRYGIPVKGTHAHSWVMSFDDEQAAFEAYASAMPNNCIFLVDTFDTLEGVRKACRVARKLQESGHEMVGIRLDSGDLAYLSIQSRKILDEAGLGDARIVASNDLDESVIESLKQQGAKVDVWGVGTKLATAYDQPALGGVYKLGAIWDQEASTWKPKIKRSEQLIKTSIPGRLQTRRFTDSGGQLLGDMIFDVELGVPANNMVDPMEPLRRKAFSFDAEYEDQLTPGVTNGIKVREPEELDCIRLKVMDRLKKLDASHLRLLNPHVYPVGIEDNLSILRLKMLENQK